MLAHSLRSLGLLHFHIRAQPAISRRLRAPLIVRVRAESTSPAAMALIAKNPSKQELQNLPGVAKERDPATKGFIFQQTMYRIKDPKVSLDFYTRILGFTLLEKLDFPDMKFSLYFLGQYPPEQIPEDSNERVEWTFSRPGCIELTHNWGSENEDKDPYYHNGNSEPGKGFGHIGLDVPDVEAACKRFEELGVKFVKKPDDGKMKGLAFIQDPDSYWIEIFNSKTVRSYVENSPK